MIDQSNLQNAQRGSSGGASGKKPMNLQDVSQNLNKEFKERKIQQAAANSGGKYGYIDIATTPINPDLYSMLDADMLLAAKFIPFFRLGSQLRVAEVDPENSELKNFWLTKATPYRRIYVQMKVLRLRSSPS